MVGWAAVEAGRAADVGTDRGTRRYGLAWAQQELCEALEEASRYLEEPFSSRVSSAGDHVKRLYMAFVEEAIADNLRHWKILRKIHRTPELPPLQLLDRRVLDEQGFTRGSVGFYFTILGRNSSMCEGGDRPTTPASG
jgi:hypothetical protein